MNWLSSDKILRGGGATAKPLADKENGMMMITIGEYNSVDVGAPFIAPSLPVPPCVRIHKLYFNNTIKSLNDGLFYKYHSSG